MLKSSNKYLAHVLLMYLKRGKQVNNPLNAYLPGYAPLPPKGRPPASLKVALCCEY